ncbi:MAG: D-alanine--D-alanine ligase [Defluviitaleaceae bacterium]|nr:D-alanine--D-alanine ligase [Defluviitaleaceae bacterium]
MNMKNVMVVFGGCSPEHDISKESARAVMGALGKYNVVPVYITRAGKWLLYDGKLGSNIQGIDWERFGTPAILSPDRVNRGLLRIVGDKVKTIPIDVALPVLHGPNGEDGTIQGLCELAGIPYVGCGVAASSIAMDKSAARLIAKALKIPQADFLFFDKSEIKADKKAVLRKIRYKLGYPCFVKPNAGGSSIGITKVSDRKELIEALETAMTFSNRVIVEKAVEGREIEVGILGAGHTAQASIPGEIIADGEFYDYEAKYEKPASQTIVPTDLSDEVVEKLQAYALEIFRAIDGRGLSRVDFFVTADGKILFNEINTVPGFTKISMYAKVWEASGISRQELIDRLIELAVDNE